MSGDIKKKKKYVEMLINNATNKIFHKKHWI